MTAGWDGARAALSVPNYRIYTVGNVVSLIGTWIQRVALGWLIWNLTGSGTWLGAVAFADLFPMVLVTPFAGAMADRSDRLRVTKVTQILLMSHAALLAGLSVFGMLSPELILVLALTGGVIAAFNQPFRMAIIPSLVDRAHLVSAVAINSMVFNTARFLGPAAAGVIIAWGDVSIAFFVNFLAFAAFSVMLAHIRLARIERPVATAGGLVRSIIEGWRYAAGHIGLAALLLTLAIVSFCIRPILELMPGYAALFGSEAAGFAAMTSVFGLGSVVGAARIGRQDDHHGLARMALSSGFLMGAALLVAASARHEWIALAALTILGYGMVVSGTATQMIIQLVVGDHLRGRVLSLHSMIFRGAPAIGALIIGAGSELVGLRWLLAVGALLTLAFSTFIWVRRARVLNSLNL